MTKIQIELSEATAKAARDAGLLTQPVLEKLLVERLAVDKNSASKPKLAEIAAEMRAAAAARGLTTEIFDAILAEP